MPHRPRHTLAVLLAVVAACAVGLGVSVVAFAQTTDTTGDYTVPLGDYTTTTPGTVPATTPLLTTPPPAETVPSGTGEVRPTVTTGRTSTTARPTVPSTVTRSGPKHLAFTGAEPIVVGLGGASLMLLGFVLHRRRRTDRPAA